MEMESICLQGEVQQFALYTQMPVNKGKIGFHMKFSHGKKMGDLQELRVSGRKECSKQFQREYS